MGADWQTEETQMPTGFIDLYWSDKRKGYDIRTDLGRPSDYTHEGHLIRLFSTKSLYYTTAHTDQDHPLYYVDKLDGIYVEWVTDFTAKQLPVAQRGQQNRSQKPMRFFSHNTDKKS